MIRFENVTKSYPGGHVALHDIDFTVQSGEFIFLTGHSGAGKSTLLKLISLVERPTTGSIYINDFCLNDVNRRNLPYLRRQIGIIFQNPTLLNQRSVFDNVALPLVITGTHPQDIERRVRTVLDKVGLRHKETAKPITLSSGEQQRVGIARAIVARPAIILADEPTGNLDPQLSEEIMALFNRFQQMGVTCIVATHDLHLINTLPYRQLNLDHGELDDPSTPSSN